jgi:hypothetical protein
MFAHKGVFHFIGRLFFVFWHITGENCKPQAKPRADRGSASYPYTQRDLWGSLFTNSRLDVGSLSRLHRSDRDFVRARETAQRISQRPQRIEDR